MNFEEIRTDGYRQLLESFLSYLKGRKYNASTLLNYQRTLTRIDKYMQSNQITTYDESVGDSYLEAYMRNSKPNVPRKNAVRTIITRLNAFSKGNAYVIQQKYKEPFLLPAEYEKVIDSYKTACKESANKAITINAKIFRIKRFLFHCGFATTNNESSQIFIFSTCNASLNQFGQIL